MDLKLYVIPGSHPCAAVEAALALKGMHYERVDLVPGVSALQQLARFGVRTVPGLSIRGTGKVAGSRLIMRTLDGLQPEPRLYTSEEVAAADAWGDKVLQTAARFIIAYAFVEKPEAGESFTAEANLPKLPAPLSARATKAVFGLELRFLAGGAQAAERWLRELPELLDRVDELIATGVIGDEASPNAADFQLGSSIRMLQNIPDLRDALDARPAGQLARRLFPRYPGEFPAGALPAEWIPSLEARQPVSA